jgi:hypothetical protein
LVVEVEEEEEEEEEEDRCGCGVAADERVLVGEQPYTTLNHQPLVICLSSRTATLN